MTSCHRFAGLSASVFAAALLVQGCSSGSKSAAQHIRGTVRSLDGRVLTIATSGGPKLVQLEQSTEIGAVIKADREHIAAGSFVGVTSVSEPDGTQRAVEIHVFPESMRGAGEGTYDWDWPGSDGSGSSGRKASRSRMTNGTVARSRMINGTTAAVTGTALTVLYKDGTADGSQTVAIAPDTPVVTLVPGTATDLQPGVAVFVVAHRTAKGTLLADRVLAGSHGTAPPM